MGKLTTKEVAGLTAPGRYTDGDGLILYVDSAGRRYWQLRYTFGGKRRDLSLGPAHVMSLRDAREMAAAARAQVRSGVDPLEAKRKKPLDTMTFEEAARKVHRNRKAGWSNGKHQKQWLSSLEIYAFSLIGCLSVASVTRAHVLEVLSPIWLVKPETARRVLQRIETVIDWAVGAGIREEGVNFNLVRKALPRQRVVVKHMAAVPVADMHKFMQALMLSPSTPIVRLAIELLILTTARPFMIRFMEWNEVDLVNAIWRVPAEKMKMDREYACPLSTRALEILKFMEIRRANSSYVFPIGRQGAPMSENTKCKAVRALGFDATAHGFRSTFKDWSRAAGWEDYLSEFQLAHLDQNQTRAAYGRDGQVERRREMMEQWAKFVAGKAPVPTLSLKT